MAQKVELDRAGAQDTQRRRVALDPECQKEMEQLLRQGEPASQRLSGLAAEWRGEMIEIRFAHHQERAMTAPVQEAPRRLRRKVRVDWYQWGIILLMLSSAVVAAIRLLGAMPQ